MKPSRELLRKLPKTDLHCHLDGSVRPTTLLELARKFSVKLPADTVEELFPHVRVAPSCGSLKEFLDVFNVIYPLLRHPEAVERIAYELVEDCAAENIRHVEARLAPELQATATFSNLQVLEAVQKGLRRGLKDFGTTSTVIVCLLREHAPERNRRAFETLKKAFKPDAALDDCAVTGLDLAGDEAAIPMGASAALYEEARDAGIWTTCHAGESGGGDLDLVFDLGVMRIGHGVKLAARPDLMKKAAARRVPVEVNLTSNVFTKSVPSLAAHPMPALRAAGVPVTLNTDDRAMMGIDLTHEYERAAELGLSFDALCGLSEASCDFAFLPPRPRAQLKARMAKEIAALRSGVPA